jgi:tetratricopeptide (TPR) repeat protein
MAAPPPLFHDIDRAMRSGDTAQAVTLAVRGLQDGHRHPVLFNLRAYHHEEAGRLGAALADLEQARILAPHDPRILNGMGRCLTSLGRLDEALAMLDQALALEPGFVAAHYNRGFALEQQGELAAARAEYEKAVAIFPRMTDAIARLASLAARRSDWPAARTLADRALAAEPDHAVARLALVMAELAAGEAGAAEIRARAVADSPLTVPQAAASAHTFLGDALDTQGRYGEAFNAYAGANGAMRSLFAERFDRAGVESGTATVRRLAASLAETSREDWAQDAQSDTPIFVLGFPRSGTTLLGQILAGHPRIATLEERPLLKEIVEEHILPKSGLGGLAKLSDAERARYRALYLEHAKVSPGYAPGRRIVDQSAFNTLHLPAIAALFPGAEVIFALRDPRDVVLSCFRRQFAPNVYTYELLTLAGAADFYGATMAYARDARAKLPLQFHVLRNEDLVADFEGEMRRACAFLGLEWDDALAAFAGRVGARASATPSATQVARGINADSVGHWRHYQAQIAGVQEKLAPWVKAFGYDGAAP